MGESFSSATSVAPIGQVAVGSVAWRSRGAMHLTVMVKARFALRHNAPMVVAGTPSICERDVHVDRDPTRSLVEASDIVPHRPIADVWLRGHAYAPQGQTVAVSVVRLALYRGQQVLLDKALHVLGDRSAADAAPQPFGRMPLVYERAYGGIGFDDNPVGVGADERPLLPNILHPTDPEQVAGFGPISRYWKLRRLSVSTDERRALEKTVPAVPEGFDWSYFQAAPFDQRLPFLQGDEWLVLDGVHPTMLRIQSRLPKTRGIVRILPADGAVGELGDMVAMVADTLAVDADDHTCTVTWRGSVPVASPERLDNMLVAGALEQPGRSVDWSRAHRNRVSPSKPSDLDEPQALDRSGVTVVSDMPAPRGVMTELGPDELAKGSVDSLTDPLADVTSVAFAKGSHRRISDATWTRGEVDDWPSYPLASSDGEEVTETKTTEIAVDGPGARDDKSRPSMPMARDTEPGGPHLAIDDMPWLSEAAVEPEAQPASTKHESDSQPGRASLPPADIDSKAYAELLRRAGASEHDIEALLATLDNSRMPPRE